MKRQDFVLKFLTIVERSQEQCKTFLDLRGSNTPNLKAQPAWQEWGDFHEGQNALFCHDTLPRFKQMKEMFSPLSLWI